MNLRGLAPFCLPCLILSAGEVREEILVVVNNHVITKREFQEAVEQGTAALYREFSGAELDAKLRNARDKILQGLVDSYVLDDKASDLGVTISDEALRGYVEELKKQNNFTSDADFDRALKGSLGIGLQAYLQRTKQDMIKQEVLRREVFSRVAVDEQELLAYYRENRQEYRLPGRFRVRELVLPKGTTPEEQKATEDRLAEIQADLKKGTPFEDLVKYSVAPSKDTGGDLGWLSKGVLRPDLEKAVLALKPGQVSAPIVSDKDVCLMQLTASEMDNYKPFTDVRTAILAKLQEPKAQNAVETYIQGLRIRANIRYMVPRDTILKG